ncbi:hypothetical protein K443DRAFT_241749 [Laccaria amethystina LaAM-08-1]|uniref:Uncharacterized protein n=1 Tax=Laccaria amethystina LaAM-08-1 TaxID=1095629 RepID=A0A0C9XIZ0_9AGAR|nr:hypothetical protein K443DRAFT_241749 [Laccaria amethystina LaAM-08-1]
MHTTLLCSDAARLTSFRILAPFLPGIPARLLGTEARFSDTVEVQFWKRVEGGHWRERTRSTSISPLYHEAPNAAIRSSNTFGILVIIFSPFPLHRAPRDLGHQESTFDTLFTSTMVSGWALNVEPLKTERLRGGEDCVGFMRALVALSRKCGFGGLCGERGHRRS